ncbi:Major Facilitator Superfamily/Nucleoside H+ symporter [Novymonas esmeraldas]|uniref:Major Facilitator Superfamily/Nucleoside H+ symporter n=1 Tax=Novymonas esmeraldas TaxID=1808958 RepID=A0AAW0EU15_9TRYP
MPYASAHDTCRREEASITSLSQNSVDSGPSLTLPMAEPRVADGSMLASALNSPTRSGVEVGFNSAVFSASNSFAGGHGGSATAARGGSVDATGSAPGASTGADGAAAATAATVVVNMTPAIIGYFSSSFGNGICAFFSRIFEGKGFEPYLIGMLVAATPLLSMTLLPLLTFIADKFRCETTVVLVCIVITTAGMFGYTASSSKVACASWFLVMTAARVTLSPLLDQRILMMFPKQGRSSAWSYVRSYAAYGWGFGCFAASLLFSYSGRWTVVTVQYMLGQAGLAYCIMVVKPYERIERVPVRFAEILHLLGGNKRLMLFLFSATMMGMGYSFIDNFLFLFLGELGGSEALMGFTVVLTVSAEIPLFQMSAQLHQRLTERQMMTIAMSIWAFRVVCYSLLTKAWMVLLIEPLHGVTFAFMWLPSMHIISRAFPPKLSSSATGVLFTLTSGVGPMIGNLTAGTLYTLIGPRKMFLFAAVTMTLALIFYQVMDHLLERRGIPVVNEPEESDAGAAGLAVVAAVDDKTAAPPAHSRPRLAGGHKSSSSSSSSHATPSSSTAAAARPMKTEGANGGRRNAGGAAEEEEECTELPLAAGV